MNKLSLTVTLAACLCATALSTGCNAQSASGFGGQQSQAQVQRAGGRGAAALQRFAAALDLTPDQVAQIKPILDGARAEAVQIRNDSTLSEEQKRAELKDLRRATAEQIKPLLTAEQLAKWKSIAGQRRQQGGYTGSNTGDRAGSSLGSSFGSSTGQSPTASDFDHKFGG